MANPEQWSELTDLVQRFAVDGVEGLTDDETAQVVVLAHRARDLFEHVEVHALGRLEESGYADRDHATTTAGWFAREARLPGRVARAQVNTARMVRHLDVADRAWLDGTINREHVQVLERAANPRVRDQVVAAQADLIGLTERAVFERWDQGVKALVESWDQDGPAPTDPANTTASWSRSGAFAALKAKFSGMDAEVLEQIIEAKTD